MQFLDDKQVRGAIQEVVAGGEVRCAVAFWGDGALKALFGTKKRASKTRIICDLTMGGTNPEELVLLGAPNNPNLKHVKGLHAKLYLSSGGMVVTSANASNRGIGFIESPVLTECGTFHRAGTTAFREAEKWFEQIWDEAGDVDPDALATAGAAWAKRPRPGVQQVSQPTDKPDTLLRRIATDPDHYRGIGVVFSSGEAEDEDVQQAADKVRKVDRARRKPKLKASEIDRLPTWPKGNLFNGWSDADASAWPKQFLCANRGARGAVSYWCYERFFEVKLDQDGWSIFADPSAELRSFLRLTGKPRSAAREEDDLLERIFAYLDAVAGPEDWGRRLCESPIHLARLLAEVAAGEA